MVAAGDNLTSMKFTGKLKQTILEHMQGHSLQYFHRLKYCGASLGGEAWLMVTALWLAVILVLLTSVSS